MKRPLRYRPLARLSACVAASLYLLSSLAAQDFRLGGFLSHGFIQSSEYNYLVDSKEGDYDFLEIGINGSWTPRDRLTVNGQLFAFELGNYGNYHPQIDYLFLDYNFSRHFGVRAGRVKRDVGVYNHIQDVDAARTTILLPIGMYDQRYRDFSASVDGASIYGTLDLAKNQTFDYSIFSGFIDLKDEGGVAGFALTSLSRTALNPEVEYIDSKYNSGVQFWYNPNIEGLRIGLGSTFIPNIGLAAKGTLPLFYPNPFLAGQEVRTETGNVDILLTQLAFEYYFKDWNFVGEYVKSDTRLDLLTTLGGIPVAQGFGKLTGDSWYLSVARRLQKFEIATTYTEFYEDSDDRDGAGRDNPSTAYNKDLQISLKYDVTNNWILKLESHSIKGTNRLFNQHGQNPMLNDNSWTLWAAKSTIFF